MTEINSSDIGDRLTLETKDEVNRRVDLYTGMTDDVPAYEGDLNKFAVNLADSEPGLQIEIVWGGLYSGIDKGYILTLPGPDSDDIFMAGVVHIPKPIGYEKGGSEPVWIHLQDLVSNKFVIQIRKAS